MVESRIRDRIEELKTRVPEPEKESISITKNTDIDFLEILKDEIDDPGQD